MFSRAAFAAALLACATVPVDCLDFRLSGINADAINIVTTAPTTQPPTTIKTPSTVSSNVSTTVSNSTTTTTTPTTTTTTTSKDPEKWTMPTVVSLQARVVSDPPVWDPQNQRYTGSFGATAEDKYVGVFDTVNTASIEGALLYVQAEGINQPEQSIQCQRKNNMRYITFYQIVYAQPPAAIAWYDANVEPMLPPEYCPYVAMDGGKCTMEGDHLPIACQQYNGQGGQPKLGMCIGTGMKASDPRAPYPDAYWFSFPNTCPFTSWKEKKTPTCRQEYPGGLCPQGTLPDGKTCSYSYEILGYLAIDALVGITTTGINGTTYSNFTEFCQAGKVEFQAVNDGAHGFTNIKSDLTFWSQPGDALANRNRTDYMIQLYNTNTQTSDTTTGQMRPLLSVEALTKKNPECYKTTLQCVMAVNGCRRTLYSQICQVCETAAEGCIKAPQGFVFPKLEIPISTAKKNTSGSSSLSGEIDSNSYGDSSMDSPLQINGKKKNGTRSSNSATTAVVSTVTIGLVSAMMVAMLL